MQDKVYLGVDIGGTSVRGIWVDESGEVVDQFSFATDGDYGKTLMNIQQAVEGGQSKPASVGIGVAMAVNNGTLRGGGKLASWLGRDLQADLHKAFQVPVGVVNDAEAATLGESTVRDEDFVFVIWGTGVGGSVCRYVSGKASVQPAEIGHMVINLDSDKLCGCGGLGHLEAHVGGGYLEGRFGAKAGELTDAQWTEVLKELAVGIYNITLNHRGLPVVFGGGVAFKQLGTAGRLQELQGYVDELTASGLTPTPTLHLSHHGEDTGMIGAEHVAREIVS